MKKIILHACCAPCASYPIIKLIEDNYEPVVFFYNPNIYPREEYEIRRNELEKYCEKIGVEYFEGRYDTSIFYEAIKGFESKHNLTYWEMGEYLGLGLASHSYLFKSRMANTEDFEKYLTLIGSSQMCYTTKNLSDSELIEEFIMLGLRTSMGIDLNILKSIYNYDLKQTKKQEIALLNDLGLITISNDKIKATDKGILVLNQIIIKLI